MTADEYVTTDPGLEFVLGIGTPGRVPRFTQKWFVSQARQLYQRIGAAQLGERIGGINLVVSRCSPKRLRPELAVSEFPIVTHNQSAI
jgi:hypothetical protein